MKRKTDEHAKDNQTASDGGGRGEGGRDGGGRGGGAVAVGREGYEAEMESSATISCEETSISSDTSCSSVEFRWNGGQPKRKGGSGRTGRHHQEVQKESSVAGEPKKEGRRLSRGLEHPVERQLLNQQEPGKEWQRREPAGRSSQQTCSRSVPSPSPSPSPPTRLRDEVETRYHSGCFSYSGSTCSLTSRLERGSDRLRGYDSECLPQRQPQPLSLFLPMHQLMLEGFHSDDKSLSSHQRQDSRVSPKQRLTATRPKALSTPKNANQDTFSSSEEEELAPRVLLVRYHSDETLDRASSRKLQLRTQRYYRRKSQDKGHEVQGSELIPDPLPPPLSSNSAPEPAPVPTRAPAPEKLTLLQPVQAKTVGASQVAIVSSKPPPSVLRLNWVDSGVYKSRPDDEDGEGEGEGGSGGSGGRGTEEGGRGEARTFLASPTPTPTVPAYDNDKRGYPRGITLQKQTKTTNSTSQPGVDFQCLDDIAMPSQGKRYHRSHHLPRGPCNQRNISSGTSRVTSSPGVTSPSSQLTVSTNGAAQYALCHPSPNNDSGVSSQSLASSPISGRAPTPPQRNPSPLSPFTSGPPQLSRWSLSTSVPRLADFGQEDHGLFRANRVAVETNSAHGLAQSDSECVMASGLNHSHYHRKSDTPSDLAPDSPGAELADEPKCSVMERVRNIERAFRSKSERPARMGFSLSSSAISMLPYESPAYKDSSATRGISSYINCQQPSSTWLKNKINSEQGTRRPQSSNGGCFAEDKVITNGKANGIPIPVPPTRKHCNVSVLNLERSSRTKPDQFITQSKLRNPKERHFSKLDDAITELEEIYKSLILSDEDLLDRAERRDLPTKFQLMRFEPQPPSPQPLPQTQHQHVNGSHDNKSKSRSPLRDDIDPHDLQRSTSESSDNFERRHHRTMVPGSDHSPSGQRAPPCRRSAIPDMICDDYAVRKYNKPNTNKSPERELQQKGPSYLLCSPVFTPTLQVEEVFKEIGDQPDIELDDCFYRKYTQSDASNIMPPHPPFGIPIGVVGQSSTTDYLHQELDPKERAKVYYRVKPREPHLVRDDMAFRNLRRDSPEKQDERVSPPLKPVTTHNMLRNTKKKLRATRSLSMNMSKMFGLNDETDHWEEPGMGPGLCPESPRAQSMQDVSRYMDVSYDVVEKYSCSGNNWENEFSTLSEPENYISHGWRHEPLGDDHSSVRSDARTCGSLVPRSNCDSSRVSSGKESICSQNVSFPKSQLKSQHRDSLSTRDTASGSSLLPFQTPSVFLQRKSTLEYPQPQLQTKLQPKPQPQPRSIVCAPSSENETLRPESAASACASVSGSGCASSCSTRYPLDENHLDNMLTSLKLDEMRSQYGVKVPSIWPIEYQNRASALDDIIAQVVTCTIVLVLICMHLLCKLIACLVCS